MTVEVAWIRGDGIGPEVTEAAIEVIAATGASVDFVEVPAGEKAYQEYGSAIPDKLLEDIRRTKVCLKGPLRNPIGGGYRSPNHFLRRGLELFASVRPNISYPGIPTPFSDVDITVLMHNMEGPDAGIDRYLGASQEIVEHIGVMTRRATERMLRFAFQFARERRRSLAIPHFADQMKCYEGSWLHIAGEVGEDYPDVAFRGFLADDLAAQLVTRPQRFSLIAGHHMWGDLFSGLCAGLVGGGSLATTINCGDQGIALFETGHGVGDDLVGKDAANPTASIVAGKYLLEELGFAEEAARIDSALREVFSSGEPLTADLGGTASLSEFATAVRQRL
jgi:isocitrate dehydrogenase (NAD+)